jgi:transcriptional regulator with XRE-family HTH domain
MSMRDNLIENIRTALEIFGLSQAEVSRRSGIHKVTINRILKRDFEPSLDACEKLARGLAVEPPARLLQKNCFGLETPLAKRKRVG